MIARSVATRWSLSTLFIAVNLLIALFFVVALLMAPVAVDQIHMDDIVLLANVAWRGVNGLAPVIDYSHFYGGFAEYFVTTSFRLFGVSYKVVDYAFVMLFVVAAGATWALCWKRLTLAETSLVTVLGAALILSLDPLEAFQHFKPGHSFVYNHVGIVLMVALTVFACRESRRSSCSNCCRRRWRASWSISLILLKTTFGLVGVSIVLACLIQKRWASAALVVAAATVTMLVVDPAMARAWGRSTCCWQAMPRPRRGAWRPAGRRVADAGDAGGGDRRGADPDGGPVARVGPDSLPLIASLSSSGLGYGAAMLTTGGNPPAQDDALPDDCRAPAGCKALTAPIATATCGSEHRELISARPVVICLFVILPAIMTSSNRLVAVRSSRPRHRW